MVKFKDILTESEILELMTQAFNAGFNQYEVVEAGHECKDTDIIVPWIFQKFLKKHAESNR